MSSLFPQAIHLTPYTADKITQLANEAEEQGGNLILTYRSPSDGFSQAGELLSVYISATGNECVSIGSFANNSLCSEITGHWIET